MEQSTTQRAMLRARNLFQQSGLSLQELGTRMGYPRSVARRAVWQFLNKTKDPRVRMLERFADAMGMTLADLILSDRAPQRFGPPDTAVDKDAFYAAVRALVIMPPETTTAIAKRRSKLTRPTQKPKGRKAR